MTVAVVGASADRSKFGNKGTRAFLAAGWRVFPVNPNGGQVEGLKAVASVADIADPLDVVSLYVPPAIGIELLPAIAAKGPNAVWVNPGAESAELLAEAARLGCTRCGRARSSRWAFHPRTFRQCEGSRRS